VALVKKTVVLGVTGGIAAYKSLDIVSRLKKMDIDVHVIMTQSAAKFVAPLSFQTLSQNQVIVDMFAEPKSFEIQHISLAQKADLFVVAPATADIIGKIWKEQRRSGLQSS
jgi:phosphopantothenoylcysteine decarboxylase/phosphopantothenate--cysteine ligase